MYGPNATQPYSAALLLRLYGRYFYIVCLGPVEPHASADPDPTTSSRVGAEGSRAAAESAA